jgi:hypothetical protein
VTIAIGASEFYVVLLLTVVIVVPVAAIAFVKGGKGLEELGKGRFSIDRDDDLGSGMSGSGGPAAAEQERAEEVRQMLEAADFRSQARGEGRIDVEREIERLMADGRTADANSPEGTPSAEPEPSREQPAGPESSLRAEVRQLVVANNERRVRRGEQPLDVESEVDRRMEEWS